MMDPWISHCNYANVRMENRNVKVIDKPNGGASSAEMQD